MSTAAPISGQESGRKPAGEAMFSGGQSTDKGGDSAMLPDIHSNSQLAKPSMQMGYETHQASAPDAGVPRFGGANSKRLATGNAGGRPH